MSAPYLTPARLSSLVRTAPFWTAFLLPPVVIFAATQGGWTLWLMPVCAWWLFGGLDLAIGRDLENADPETTDIHLWGYRLITTLWVPVQFLTLFGLIWYAAPAVHLTGWEKLTLFLGVGIMTGTIGINFSHELMHQSNKVERWMADLLLAMVLYSHFRSEHLLVHHRYVATPRDAVTARYNEGFYRFFARVLTECLASAFRAEARLQSRKSRPWTHLSNPFWRYWLLQTFMLGLAGLLGGWTGLGLFLFQAAIAIWQLELVNYVEHYGLTRRHLGEGRYEHVHPRHSWNASHRASNRLLINLQRHSDHHYRPDRRFPLLQTYGEDDAPQLPHGYPMMTIAAMIPPLWRRMMNPRVRAWRRHFYPDITDWKPYFKGGLPLPK
ncbi:MAG: alkane 1-monooxygenase [Pseudomonadota bacterium]